MITKYCVHPSQFSTFGTTELRDHFLMEEVFVRNKMTMVYSHEDRMMYGGVMPIEPVELEGGEALKCDFFLERRELGIINIGGAGRILVDGKSYDLASLDGMYIGMGTSQVLFSSIDKENPAKFYLNCAPAHKKYKTVHIQVEGEPSEDAIVVDEKNIVTLGSREESNHRKIRKYIVPGQVESCQLLMGMTSLLPGNVWNTMPCHLHERRMEVYFYFNVPSQGFVSHFIGEPNETRHIIVRNEQAVLSPSWSIHAGCGTSAYTFIWGMAGENQDFGDMDKVGNEFVV